INVLDQMKEDFALKTQRQIAYAMYSGKKGVQDLESAAKLQDIEAVLSKRVSGETKIFSVSLNVVLRNSDPDELDAQCAEVLSKFREISGAEGILETIAASYIFYEVSLPNARCTERTRPMNTEVLADFLPIYGEWLGHTKPRVLLKNKSKGLIGFDPFSPTHTNYNQLISGSSGAGKSYFGNILISNLMKESPQVFIIDVGGSYKKTTENFNGQYIPIGADSQISINPFDLSSTDIEAKDQKIKFLTSLVELMTKEEDEKGIRKLQRAEIEMMIKSIIQTNPEAKLSDLKNRLLESSDESVQKMGKILEPWCGDTPYGKFIDQKTNLSLDKKIVCFDLKGLENLPDLQAVCLFLITDLIWREVQKDKINQKFVIFDESWTLLDNDAGAKLIESVFRTFRKYMASAIAISQSIEDFADSKIAKAIFSCSSVKWILRQNTSRRELVQKVLSLNDREMDLIDSVTSKKGYFSEAFLISGDDKQVVKIESTPLEYWLSTTDPIDMKKMDELKADYPDTLSLFKYLAEKYPHGAS
ncbi:MAG: ATP-binding protein, partial [Bdellovibrionaceae bacterium]|nr:ATP-binding protein [Pseudobdellovibrionaceae bacterium]